MNQTIFPGNKITTVKGVEGEELTQITFEHKIWTICPQTMNKSIESPPLLSSDIYEFQLSPFSQITLVP